MKIWKGFFQLLETNSSIPRGVVKGPIRESSSYISQIIGSALFFVFALLHLGDSISKKKIFKDKFSKIFNGNFLLPKGVLP